MHNFLDQASYVIGAILATNFERGDDQKMTWIYRTVIASLLAIIGTLFMAERFLPYPWLIDKPMVNARITMLEEQRSRTMSDLTQIKKDLNIIKMYLIQRANDKVPPVNNLEH